MRQGITILVDFAMEDMLQQTHETGIVPHKIDKPLQVLAAWLIALILLDSAFLTAAANIEEPTWIRPLLIIAAILFVPLFLVFIFLMQTKFRPQLQADPYYEKWLERQDRVFGNFFR